MLKWGGNVLGAIIETYLVGRRSRKLLIGGKLGEHAKKSRIDKKANEVRDAVISEEVLPFRGEVGSPGGVAAGS